MSYDGEISIPENEDFDFEYLGKTLNPLIQNWVISNQEAIGNVGKLLDSTRNYLQSIVVDNTDAIFTMTTGLQEVLLTSLKAIDSLPLEEINQVMIDAIRTISSIYPNTAEYEIPIDDEKISIECSLDLIKQNKFSSEKIKKFWLAFLRELLLDIMVMVVFNVLPLETANPIIYNITTITNHYEYSLPEGSSGVSLVDPSEIEENENMD